MSDFNAQLKRLKSGSRNSDCRLLFTKIQFAMSDVGKKFYPMISYSSLHATYQLRKTDVEDRNNIYDYPKYKIT